MAWPDTFGNIREIYYFSPAAADDLSVDFPRNSSYTLCICSVQCIKFYIYELGCVEMISMKTPTN